MTDDQCDYIKDGGEPCELPACREDGRCWHHTEAEERKNGGRESKLTRARQERIAQAIEDGESITAAARKNGIHPETLRRWMRQGEQQEQGIYADFYDRLTRARGVGESFYVQALIEIAKENDDTATLMTMLKQRYPESWGDVERGEQTGGVVVQVGDAEEYEVDPETLELVDEN